MHDAAVVELLIATSGHMQPWNGRLNWKNSRVITSVRRPSPESRTGSRAWLSCSLGMVEGGVVVGDENPSAATTTLPPRSL